MYTFFFYCLSSLAAPETVMNGSVVKVLTPDIEILDNGRTIRDVIDSKIKEFDIGVSIRYSMNLCVIVRKFLSMAFSK